MNFKGNQSLKNRFPFRLGTTSYVIPAGLVQNVIFLADKVDNLTDKNYQSIYQYGEPGIGVYGGIKVTF